VLTPEQMEALRAVYQRWRQFPAPCGISHDDPYNPCLPEEVEPGRLACLTCYTWAAAGLGGTP
jgi:hypothetical protein